jgi:hypothetical protein
MKIISAIVLIFSFSSLTVFAYDDTVFESNVGETIGYVLSIRGDIVQVLGEPLAADGFSNVLVNIENAPVYDLRTGFRVLAQNIREEMDIRVAYHIRESEPFPAVVAWLNWNDEDAAVFTVTVSENIVSDEDDVIFLSADKKYRVALTPQTIIYDPFHGLLSPQEISHGTELFVWVDMITASAPALVYPDKVVVVY